MVATCSTEFGSTFSNFVARYPFSAFVCALIAFVKCIEINWFFVAAACSRNELVLRKLESWGYQVKTV